MPTPYASLPPTAWWAKSVPDRTGLYHKKFDISQDDKVATAGSCFAQHIATHMRANGYNVPNYEPAPLGLKRERRFGYGVYSARYANIYTPRHLLQLLREAWGEAENPEPIWTREGQYFDSMRPFIEPEGSTTASEVRALRRHHLACVRRMIKDMSVFVFTFGLTEAWMHRRTGWVFPGCPGTSRIGEFSPRYVFHNFDYREILSDFMACREFIKAKNEGVRFLVTVSPVPLVATATGQHVLPATIYSKSVLRAVAGKLADRFDDLAYFPSYEIIASHPSKGRFYEPDLREVTPQGVSTVMRLFFAEHGVYAAKSKRVRANDEINCEEILLESEK